MKKDFTGKAGTTGATGTDSKVGIGVANANYVLRPGYGVSQSEPDKLQYEGLLLTRDCEQIGLSQQELESSRTSQPEMVRLHLELVEKYRSEATKGPWIDANEAKTLKHYGNAAFGSTISRDVVVPANLSLHALHYVIQQCFGWQNSHLHSYKLPEKSFNALTSNGVKDWLRLVGLLWRSPLMDENEQFWDDDYETGSFKTYLRKKYKWPQADLCGGETYRFCQRDVERIIERLGSDEFTVDWAQDTNEDGGALVIACYPARDKNGKPTKRPGYIGEDSVVKTETMMFSDLPARALVYLFEDDPQALLERLPIGSVLAFGKDGLLSNGYSLAIGEYCCKSCERFMADVDAVNEILLGEDENEVEDEDDGREEAMYSQQPHIPPVADHIFYYYDFGDDWCVRITGSHNCVDLVKQGRVKQEEIDEALKLYVKKGLPTCIARDGMNVMDDVGGLGGFVEFLETINGEDESEKEPLLEWAAEMGWSKRKVAPKNVL